MFYSKSLILLFTPPTVLLFYTFLQILPGPRNTLDDVQYKRPASGQHIELLPSGDPIEIELVQSVKAQATLTEALPADPFSNADPGPILKDSPQIPGQLWDFPPVIWQTTASKPLTEERRDDIASWRNKNPFFSFHLLTDDQGDDFVATHYTHRPDIIRVFQALTIGILKADLLRYLMLLAVGGVWADTDVKCEVSVDQWIPQEIINSGQRINLVIGVEFDGDFHQFTNWAILGRAGNKHLQRVVDSILAELQATAAENGVGVSGITLGMLTDVVDVTGPRKMSEQIIESLQDDLGREIDYHEYTGLKQPKIIGDVLILPGMAFAAAQSGFAEDQGPALVMHHYAGSWKDEADAAREQRHEEGK